MMNPAGYMGPHYKLLLFSPSTA